MHANFGLLIVLLAASRLRPAVASFSNDFSGYPSGTQDCLYAAADQSGCQGDTAETMNSCLCSNGGDFITNSGTCIAQQDSGDMRSTWEIMYSHCGDSGTPVSVSEDDFLALAANVTTTASASGTKTSATSTASTTSTATSTATSDNDGDQQGELSRGARIGIAAGAAVAGCALLLAAVFLFMRYRKRHRPYEEVYPMSESKPSPSVGNQNLHPGDTSVAPSELESTGSTMGSPAFGQTWQPSWTGSQMPWAASQLGPAKDHSQAGAVHEAQTSEIYEMSAENEIPTSAVSSASRPSEIPSISVVSPPLSPTSPYAGGSWNSELPAEHNRYEPFRPK